MIHNQTYAQLLVVVKQAEWGGANSIIRIQANGSTTVSKTSGWDNPASSGFSSAVGQLGNTNHTGQTAFLIIQNYADSTYRKIGSFSAYGSVSNGAGCIGGYFYDATTAITSLTFALNGGSYSAGQVLIYGVK